MREILFRGKRIDNGEWEYGNCVFTENKVCLIYNQTHSIDLQGFTVEENSVGQYTGMTDKNGKKIFEGDIVRYNDTIHKVIFCTINGSAFFGITMPDRGEIWNFDGITCANKMEVIGNIHDTPELFKEREGQ